MYVYKYAKILSIEATKISIENWIKHFFERSKTK